MEQRKKYLFVVAHPDDEVLAAGATMCKLTQQGHLVYVCVMNSVSDIRCKDSETMMYDMKKSHAIIGVRKSYVGDFPTMRFNVTPQRELVQFIERAISDCQPDIVVTHHPSDLHNDHQNTSIACRTAVRLPQRQTQISNRIKNFYYMEVPSSTDWAVSNIHDSFIPNVYSEIDETHFSKKINALQVYQEGAIIRKSPHPRSEEMLKALAMKRGSEIGYKLAESFELVFGGGF